MTLSDPEMMGDDKIVLLNEQFRGRSERIDELRQHSRIELGEYVRTLAKESPPGDRRPRWEIYGWSLMPTEHYANWSKWMLVQRILKMEEHDALRRAGQVVAGVGGEVVPLSPQQVTGAGEVKPGDASETATEEETRDGGEPVAKDQETDKVLRETLSAYDEGFFAGKHGNKKDNPHERGRADWLRWNQGYQAGGTARKLVQYGSNKDE